MVPFILILLIGQVSGQDPYSDAMGPDSFYPVNGWIPNDSQQQAKAGQLLPLTNLDPFFLSDAAIPSNVLASNGLEISHYAKPKPKPTIKPVKHTRPVMMQDNINIDQLMGQFTGRVQTTDDLLMGQFTGEGAAPLINIYKDVGRRRFGQSKSNSVYGGLVETKQPSSSDGRCYGRPGECKGGCCISGRCSGEGRRGGMLDACRKHIIENGRGITGIWYKTDACPCQRHMKCLVLAPTNDNGFCMP